MEMEAVVVFHVSQRAFLRQGSGHENIRDGRMLIVFPYNHISISFFFGSLVPRIVGPRKIFHLPSYFMFYLVLSKCTVMMTSLLQDHCHGREKSCASPC